LGMALDEPKENDEVFNENGLTFLINKELLDSVKPISVEFVETSRGSGFSVTSALSNKGKDDNCCGTCSC
jgi:iron-sulfur cluster assembly protein